MGIKQRLRSWLVEKASSAAPLISMQNLGQAVWTPRRYDKFAEEGYKKNVVVYKAINELMTAAKQAVWRAGTLDAEGEFTPAPTSPLAKLLRRPNEFQGSSAFFGELAGFKLISGNAYIEAVKSSPGRPPMELHNLRPDRMKVIAGTTGPAGYEYTVGGTSKKWAIDENAIRHLKTFNPLDDWYGMSPIEAAAYDVDIHNATLAWNKALLDNGARPSGALVYAPKRDTAPDTLDEAQFKRLKQEIGEQYSGPGNAGRPMLLEGGLMWQQFGLTPADMDYINSKNTTARDIAMAFGVPPQLLGIPGDNTYSNMKEARLALWEQTVLPQLYDLEDELNAWLAPQFGDEYIIELDEDAILALAARREAIWERIEKATHLTTNEKRLATGYEAVDNGDDILVPATMVPLGTNPFDTPTPVRDEEGDEE